MDCDRGIISAPYVSAAGNTKAAEATAEAATARSFDENDTARFVAIR